MTSEEVEELAKEIKINLIQINDLTHSVGPGEELDRETYLHLNTRYAEVVLLLVKRSEGLEERNRQLQEIVKILTTKEP
jgi:hypothetical protein